MSPNKHLTVYLKTVYGYRFKMVFACTADDKQLTKSSRQLKGYSSRKFL